MALSYIEGPYLNLLRGDIKEIFQDFERRFDTYCIQSGFRDVSKDPETERVLYYKEPLLEIAALKASIPDQELKLIEQNINENNTRRDRSKPWIWMEKLRQYFTEQSDEDSDSSSSSEESNTKDTAAMFSPSATTSAPSATDISQNDSRKNSSSKREEPYFERRRSYADYSRQNSSSSTCSSSSSTSNDIPFRGEPSKWSSRGVDESRNHSRVEGQRVQNIKAEFASRIEQQQSKNENSYKKEKESSFVSKVREENKSGFVTQMEEKQMEPSRRRSYYSSAWEKRRNKSIDEGKSENDEDAIPQRGSTPTLVTTASTILNVNTKNEEENNKLKEEGNSQSFATAESLAREPKKAFGKDTNEDRVTEPLSKHIDDSDADSTQSPEERKLCIDDIMDGVQMHFAELAKLRKDSEISQSEESKYTALLEHHKQKGTATLKANIKTQQNGCEKPWETTRSRETKHLSEDGNSSDTNNNCPATKPNRTNDKALYGNDKSLYGNDAALYGARTTIRDMDTVVCDNIGETLVTDQPMYASADSHETSSQMNNISTNAHEDNEQTQHKNTNSRNSDRRRRSHEENFEMKIPHLNATTKLVANESSEDKKMSPVLTDDAGLPLVDASSRPDTSRGEGVPDKVYAKAISCLNDIISDVGRAMEEQHDEYECEELKEAVGGSDVTHAHCELSDMIDELERTISRQTRLGVGSDGSCDGEMDAEGKKFSYAEVVKGFARGGYSDGEKVEIAGQVDCESPQINGIGGTFGNDSNENKALDLNAYLNTDESNNSSDEDEDASNKSSPKGGFDLSRYLAESSDEDELDSNQEKPSLKQELDLGRYFAADETENVGGEIENVYNLAKRSELHDGQEYSEAVNDAGFSEPENEDQNRGFSIGVTGDHDNGEIDNQNDIDKRPCDMLEPENHDNSSESFDLDQYLVTHPNTDDSSSEESPRNENRNNVLDLNMYIITEEESNPIDEKDDEEVQSTTDENTLDNSNDNITEHERFYNDENIQVIEEKILSDMSDEVDESDYIKTGIDIELIEEGGENETIKTEIEIDFIDSDKDTEVIEQEVIIEFIENEGDSDNGDAVPPTDTSEAEDEPSRAENEIVVEIFEEEIESDDSDTETDVQNEANVEKAAASSADSIQVETIIQEIEAGEEESGHEISKEDTTADETDDAWKISLQQEDAVDITEEEVDNEQGTVSRGKANIEAQKNDIEFSVEGSEANTTDENCEDFLEDDSEIETDQSNEEHISNESFDKEYTEQDIENVTMMMGAAETTHESDQDVVEQECSDDIIDCNEEGKRLDQLECEIGKADENQSKTDEYELETIYEQSENAFEVERDAGIPVEMGTDEDHVKERTDQYHGNDAINVEVSASRTCTDEIATNEAETSIMIHNNTHDRKCDQANEIQETDDPGEKDIRETVFEDEIRHHEETEETGLESNLWCRKDANEKEFDTKILIRHVEYELPQESELDIEQAFEKDNSVGVNTGVNGDNSEWPTREEIAIGCHLAEDDSNEQTHETEPYENDTDLLRESDTENVQDIEGSSEEKELEEVTQNAEENKIGGETEIEEETERYESDVDITSQGNDTNDSDTTCCHETDERTEGTQFENEGKYDHDGNDIVEVGEVKGNETNETDVHETESDARPINDTCENGTNELAEIDAGQASEMNVTENKIVTNIIAQESDPSDMREPDSDNDQTSEIQSNKKEFASEIDDCDSRFSAVENAEDKLVQENENNDEDRDSDMVNDAVEDTEDENAQNVKYDLVAEKELHFSISGDSACEEENEKDIIEKKPDLEMTNQDSEGESKYQVSENQVEIEFECEEPCTDMYAREDGTKITEGTLTNSFGEGTKSDEFEDEIPKQDEKVFIDATEPLQTGTASGINETSERLIEFEAEAIDQGVEQNVFEETTELHGIQVDDSGIHEKGAEIDEAKPETETVTQENDYATEDNEIEANKELQDNESDEETNEIEEIGKSNGNITIDDKQKTETINPFRENINNAGSEFELPGEVHKKPEKDDIGTSHTQDAQMAQIDAQIDENCAGIEEVDVIDDQGVQGVNNEEDQGELELHLGDLDINAIENDAKLNQINCEITDIETESELEFIESGKQVQGENPLGAMEYLMEINSQSNTVENIREETSTAAMAGNLDLSHTAAVKNIVDDLIVNAENCLAIIEQNDCVNENTLESDDSPNVSTDDSTKEIVSLDVFEDSDSEGAENNHLATDEVVDENSRKSSDSESADSDSDITITVTKMTDSDSSTSDEHTLVTGGSNSLSDNDNTQKTMSRVTDNALSPSLDDSQRLSDDSTDALSKQTDPCRSASNNILQNSAIKNARNSNTNFDVNRYTHHSTAIRTRNALIAKYRAESGFMQDVTKIGRQSQMGNKDIINEVRGDVNTQYYAFNFDYIHGVKKSTS